MHHTLHYHQLYLQSVAFGDIICTLYQAEVVSLNFSRNTSKMVLHSQEPAKKKVLLGVLKRYQIFSQLNGLQINKPSNYLVQTEFFKWEKQANLIHKKSILTFSSQINIRPSLSKNIEGKEEGRKLRKNISTLSKTTWEINQLPTLQYLGYAFSTLPNEFDNT